MGLKNVWKGGGQRLMANAILNFHFLFWTPPLVWQVESTQCLSAKKYNACEKIFPRAESKLINCKIKVLVVLITTNPRVIISLMYDSGSSTWLHCSPSRCSSPSSQLLHFGKVLTITHHHHHTTTSATWPSSFYMSVIVCLYTTKWTIPEDFSDHVRHACWF